MNNIVMLPYPILSAEGFVEQGTTPGQILSIAAHNQRVADQEQSPSHRDAARRLRKRAWEVADLMGINTRSWRRPRSQRKTRSEQRRRAA